MTILDHEYGRDGDHAQGVLIPESHRGYRRWILNRITTLRGETVELRSVGVQYTWRQGLNVARCHFHGGIYSAVPIGHLPPQSMCSCGFYSAHDMSQLEPVNGNVIGAIRISGKTILGTKGSRTEKAEIEGLAIEPWVFFGDPIFGLADIFDTRPHVMKKKEISEMLSLAYGVPVFGDAHELREAFPPIPVDKLLEESSPVGKDTP